MFTIVFGRGNRRVVVEAGSYSVEDATRYIKGWIQKDRIDV